MMFYFYPHFKKISIIVLLLLLSGCSGHEKSGEQRLRDQNAKGEYVYRNHDERQYPLNTPSHREREPYPWENEVASK